MYQAYDYQSYHEVMCEMAIQLVERVGFENINIVNCTKCEFYSGDLSMELKRFNVLIYCKNEKKWDFPLLYVDKVFLYELKNVQVNDVSLKSDKFKFTLHESLNFKIPKKVVFEYPRNLLEDDEEVGSGSYQSDLPLATKVDNLGKEKDSQDEQLRVSKVDNLAKEESKVEQLRVSLKSEVKKVDPNDVLAAKGGRYQDVHIEVK